MNLGEIESTIYDRLGFKSTPESPIVRRVRREVNDSHKEILGKRAFSRLRRYTLTASSVSSSPFMALPQAAVRIVAIVDRTNRRPLDPVSLQDLRYRDPGNVYTGSIPNQFAILNFSAALAIQPSAAASLYVISDDAKDGSGMSASIEGIVTGGYYRRASVAMNGLTGVNLSAAVSSWLYITKFYISAKAAGNITLREGSGVGTELSHIPPGRSYPRYTIVQLADIPASVILYHCDVELRVEDMVSVNDEPLLPEDFHWLMECGAMRKEFLKREKINLWKIEDANWRQGIADLRGWISSQPGVSTEGQRGSFPRRFSQLGANFPSGS